MGQLIFLIHHFFILIVHLAENRCFSLSTVAQNAQNAGWAIFTVDYTPVSG